jgi:hypothetical protein
MARATLHVVVKTYGRVDTSETVAVTGISAFAAAYLFEEGGGCVEIIR